MENKSAPIGEPPTALFPSRVQSSGIVMRPVPGTKKIVFEIPGTGEKMYFDIENQSSTISIEGKLVNTMIIRNLATNKITFQTYDHWIEVPVENDKMSFVFNNVETMTMDQYDLIIGGVPVKTNIGVIQSAIGWPYSDADSIGTRLNTIEPILANAVTNILNNGNDISTIYNRIGLPYVSPLTVQERIEVNAADIGYLGVRVTAIEESPQEDAEARTAIGWPYTNITSLDTRVTNNAESVILLNTQQDINTNNININAEDITSLETLTGNQGTALTALTQVVTTNSTAIGSNDTDISNLQSLTNSHTTSIGNNTTDIGVNATSIETLQTTTGTNTSNIVDLQSLTGIHTTGIATNVSDISALDVRVTTLEIGDVDTESRAAIGWPYTNDTSLDSRVTTNTDNIATLDTTVSGHTTNISINAGNIGTNVANIASNSGAISASSSIITTNSGNISLNTGNIATNINNISTLNTTVSGHTNSINTNTSNISTLNTTVSSHTTSINTNASNISSLNTTVSSHTTSIATNASAIQGNSNAISTNQTNISNNYTDIANLKTIVSYPLQTVTLGSGSTRVVMGKDGTTYGFGIENTGGSIIMNVTTVTPTLHLGFNTDRYFNITTPTAGPVSRLNYSVSIYSIRQATTLGISEDSYYGVNRRSHKQVLSTGPLEYLYYDADTFIKNSAGSSPETLVQYATNKHVKQYAGTTPYLEVKYDTAQSIKLATAATLGPYMNLITTTTNRVDMSAIPGLGKISVTSAGSGAATATGGIYSNTTAGYTTVGHYSQWGSHFWYNYIDIFGNFRFSYDSFDSFKVFINPGGATMQLNFTGAHTCNNTDDEFELGQCVYMTGQIKNLTECELWEALPIVTNDGIPKKFYGIYLENIDGDKVIFDQGGFTTAVDKTDNRMWIGAHGNMKALAYPDTYEAGDYLIPDGKYLRKSDTPGVPLIRCVQDITTPSTKITTIGIEM